MSESGDSIEPESDVPFSDDSDYSDVEEEKRKRGHGVYYTDFGEIFERSRTEEVELPIEHKMDVIYTDKKQAIHIFSKADDDAPYKEELDYIVKFRYDERDDNIDIDLNNHRLNVLSFGLDTGMTVNMTDKPNALWIVLDHFVKMGITTIGTLKLESEEHFEMDTAEEALRNLALKFERVILRLGEEEENQRSTKRMYRVFLQKCTELVVTATFDSKMPIIPNNTSKLRKFKLRVAGSLPNNNEWFKVDDVLALRHCEVINVMHEKFTHREVNKIFKYWQKGKLNFKHFQCQLTKWGGCSEIEEGLNAEHCPRRYFRQCWNSKPMKNCVFRRKISRADGLSGKLTLRYGIALFHILP